MCLLWRGPSKSVDLLDLRIVRELTWKNPAQRRPEGVARPWDVARNLGLHGNTVKSRLDEMRRAGVLGPVLCVPVPQAFGLHSAVFEFKYADDKTKQKSFEFLRTSSSVHDSMTFLDGYAWAGIGARIGDSPDEQARLLAAATGAGPPRRLYSRGIEKPLSTPLTPLDARIILALLEDAHRPLSEVAAEVGVTARTVRTRYHGALEKGNVLIIPQVNLGRVNGLIAYMLLIQFTHGATSEARAALLSKLPGYITSNHDTVSQTGYVALAAEHMAALEAVKIEVLESPLVASLDVRYMTDRTENLEMMRRHLQRVADEGAPAPEASAPRTNLEPGG